MKNYSLLTIERKLKNLSDPEEEYHGGDFLQEVLDPDWETAYQ